uniref:Uncharacterized protein n=1 Tax=Arundo donax TaxID=35708 RepID=A0A0A9FSF6_ARUDO
MWEHNIIIRYSIYSIYIFVLLNCRIMVFESRLGNTNHWNMYYVSY